MGMKVRALLGSFVVLSTMWLAGCGHYTCGNTFGNATCTSSGGGISQGGGGNGAGFKARFYFVDFAQAGSTGGMAETELNGIAGTFSAITTFTAPALPTQPTGLVIVNKKFMYVPSSNGILVGYSIDMTTGFVKEVPNSPYAVVGGTSIASNSTGTLIFVGDVTGQRIFVFGVNADGSLTAVTGSPFSTSGVRPAVMATDGQSKFLYITEGAGSTRIAAFSIGSNGALNVVPGEPFSFTISSIVGDPSGKYMLGVTGQAADIAIAKVASAPVVALGSNVTFVITATNNGPSAATGVQVTDVLPAGLTLVSATASAGTSYNAGTGVWNIGALANGGGATLTIVARVTTTTPATNTASKTAENQPDPVAGNNSASATVTGASADISVVKTVNTTTPSMGQNVTFTLVVNNLGPSTATGVQLSDPLPAGVTFVSYAATQGTYNAGTGIWNVGTLVNGAGATLSLVVKVRAMGNIVNTVTVLPGPYFDPNLNNNVSAVTIDPLPGLPNTSAPDAAATGPRPFAPQQITGLLVTVLTVVAGLGVLVLGGIGWRRGSRFGQRRSRGRRRLNEGRFTVGLVAVVLSAGIASMAFGEVGTPAPAAPSTTSAAPATVAEAGPGTQLIGGTIVTTAAPAPPQAETFNRVSGPITPSRLRIPTIGVDAWVGAVGLRSDGSMDVPNNLWTSSWLASGPKPGQAGNAVIAAHRGVGSPALFSHLENVRPGDRIYVSDAAGNEIAYSVTAVVSLDLSVSSQREVFAPATAQQLVLITCFGRYIPSARTYDHRLVVVGQPLPPAA